MEQIGVEIIKQWGLIGLIIVILLVVCGVLGWLLIKNSREDDNKKDSQDILLNSINSSLNGFKSNMFDKIDLVNERIDIMEDRFDSKITLLEENVNNKITAIEDKVDDLPNQNIKMFNRNNEEINNFTNGVHSKAIEDIMKLGPKIYDLLNDACIKINCTHLFIGSFHNGSNDLHGFPYIKMNIIREAYHPNEMVKEDHPFAPVYKDCDLTLLGKLPSLLIQKKMLHFNVDDLNSDIFKYDSLIGRRMIGMGIKQIALYGLFENDKISGFIGCVRYDDKEMNMKEIKTCVKELELIHNYSTVDKFMHSKKHLNI